MVEDLNGNFSEENLPFFQLTYSQLFKLINSSIISTMRGVDRSKVAAGS